jgi:hypothetical protein
MPHLLVQIPPLPLDATIPISHTGPPLYKEPDNTDSDDWATYSTHQPTINQDSYYYEYKSPVIDVLSKNGHSVEEGRLIVANSNQAAFLDANINDTVEQAADKMELPQSRTLSMIIETRSNKIPSPSQAQKMTSQANKTC